MCPLEAEQVMLRLFCGLSAREEKIVARRRADDEIMAPQGRAGNFWARKLL
jgi:hypothetical protein